MDISTVHPPLSNIQAELLKNFSADIPGEHLKEFKNIIARYLLDKARDKADAAETKKVTLTKNSGICSNSIPA